MNNAVNKNINKYCGLLEEIKKRDAVVKGFLKGSCFTPYSATSVECMCLQVRKILELIALGSLVLNRQEFAKYHKNFHKFWHGGRIMNDIEKVNPDFYPNPIEEILSQIEGVKYEWKNVKDGFLTKDDFVKTYEKCGKIMHADNPFGSKTDYSYYEKQISQWMTKISKLLKSHQIKLLSDNNLYLFHMAEKRDGKVHGYTFAPSKPPIS